ncbi:MAG: antitoxin VapB family protein [Candidatus Woesearchaeota archaeon]
MTSTNISLKKEAYDFLLSQKKKTMSFSDVVLTFKYGKKTQSLQSFKGTLKGHKKDLDLKKMKKFRKEIFAR